MLPPLNNYVDYNGTSKKGYDNAAYCVHTYPGKQTDINTNYARFGNALFCSPIAIFKFFNVTYYCVTLSFF